MEITDIKALDLKPSTLVVITATGADSRELHRISEQVNEIVKPLRAQHQAPIPVMIVNENFSIQTITRQELEQLLEIVK